MTDQMTPDTIEGHSPRQASQFGSDFPCACGAGCKGYGSSKAGRIRSERDVVADNIKRHGGMLFWNGEATVVSQTITSLEAYDSIPAEGTKAAKDAEGRRKAAARHPRHAEAVEYARHYVGNFGFMQQMRLKTEELKFRGFSDGQVEAIVKCMDREAQWKKERADRPASGVDFSGLPTGTFRVAVDNDSNGVTFFKVDRPASGKWEGWTFVKQQQGPDVEAMRVGSQKPGQTYSGKWVNLMARIVEDFHGALKRYGLELGHCGVCGLALTNDESRELGIGPVCASKV